MPSTTSRLTTVKIARGILYLVYFWVIVSLIILLLGFFLKLFNANPDAGFTEWAYRNLDRVMKPFRGIFPEAPVGQNGSVFDTSILFAMIIYGIVALGFQALLDWLTVRMRRLQHEIELAEDRAAYEAALAQASPTTVTVTDAGGRVDLTVGTTVDPTRQPPTV